MKYTMSQINDKIQMASRFLEDQDRPIEDCYAGAKACVTAARAMLEANFPTLPQEKKKGICQFCDHSECRIFPAYKCFVHRCLVIAWFGCIHYEEKK